VGLTAEVVLKGSARRAPRRLRPRLILIAIPCNQTVTILASQLLGQNREALEVFKSLDVGGYNAALVEYIPVVRHVVERVLYERLKKCPLR
jgi:hypothetical protein